jgi:hypothetical protein
MSAKLKHNAATHEKRTRQARSGLTRRGSFTRAAARTRLAVYEPDAVARERRR